MTISRTADGGLDALLSQIQQQRNQVRTSTESQATPNLPAKIYNKNPQDFVSLSGQKSNDASVSGFANKQNNATRLVGEQRQELENGVRVTQEFEKPNGKKFTRIEEVTTEENRSKRLILQQNESGSTTTLENIIDQQDDGSFRLVQRFTDETGETKANVQLNYTPTQNDGLFGNIAATTSPNSPPLGAPRGSQLDVSV